MRFFLPFVSAGASIAPSRPSSQVIANLNPGELENQGKKRSKTQNALRCDCDWRHRLRRGRSDDVATPTRPIDEIQIGMSRYVVERVLCGGSRRSHVESECVGRSRNAM